MIKYTSFADCHFEEIVDRESKGEGGVLGVNPLTDHNRRASVHCTGCPAEVDVEKSRLSESPD